jgi:pyridoxamine 5'-phosphate oxidase-like protein
MKPTREMYPNESEYTIMDETDTDFQNLQTLLDHSIEQAGPFLRESFQMPTHSLSARQLTHLWQALQNIALATVTSKGEPRVTPIGALLFHGQWYIPTVAAALRTKHLLHHPVMSFTYYQGDDLAIIAHGSAHILRPDHPDFPAVEAFQQEQTGSSVLTWGEGVFFQVTPRALYTFVRYPDRYPER